MASLKKTDLSNLIGRKVGSCTLLKEIARGNMGAVFLGYQSSLKRQIAVKVLPKSIITPLKARLFQREAELVAGLTHPSIIPVYEVGDAGEFLFILMQLVKGKPLSYYIEKSRKNILPSKRTLPLAITFNIIISVLNALDYAHSQSIIHRDIKPANILIDSYDNRPVIVDFGIAQVSRNAEEADSIIAGTPLYTAPEQIFESEADRRADIYSTGAVLFEMLAPMPLFQDIHSAMEFIKLKIELKDKLYVKKPSEVNPELNKKVDPIILKALAFEPEHRYATCREFREQLERYSKNYIMNKG